MGLEPEAVGVLRDLDAQVGAGEAGAEVLLDAVGDGLALEGVVEGLAYRKWPMFAASKSLQVLFCSSRLPETPSSGGASNGRPKIVSTASSGRQWVRNQCW